jgi:methylenetetrahydrofolate dehydrogenase (NADP+) / methenyltetrahydrofolate cyclohydrolase
MIIDGKSIAKTFLDDVQHQISLLSHKRPPCLAFILVGENPASQLYVKLKVQTCEKIGIIPKGFNFDSNVTQKQILDLLESLNKDPNVDGILIQMPLPVHLNTQKIIESINPKKDVDGFHPLNMGRLVLGYTPYFIPCTPLGIHEMLLKSNIEISHKHVVIMGRSNIVGKPLAALLVQKNNEANATVSIVHSHTKEIDLITQSADILIAAMGSPLFVKGPMIKKDAVVIDVGINRLHGKLVGDVDFEEAKAFTTHISPVPGGVGPMTIAMLMCNTLKAYQLHCQLT